LATVTDASKRRTEREFMVAHNGWRTLALPTGQSVEVLKVKENGGWKDDLVGWEKKTRHDDASFILQKVRCHGHNGHMVAISVEHRGNDGGLRSPTLFRKKISRLLWKGEME
jgi:hypothetical protein